MLEKSKFKLWLYILVILIISFSILACNDKKASENEAMIQDNQLKEDINTPYELNIIVQDSPPFSFMENGEMTGFVIDIVKEIMTRQDINTAFTVLPFKRGYELVSQEPMTVLCGMTRTEEREDLFKWVGPVSRVTTGFYAKSDSDILIDSIDDAKQIDSIGVTLGYYTESLLVKKNFDNLDSVSYPEDMLEKLILGRSSLILSDDIAMSGLLTSANLDLSDVKIVYEVMTAESYLAFSLNTPDEIVKQWQDVFDEVYKDGSIQAIYDFWLPNVEVPSID